MNSPASKGFSELYAAYAGGCLDPAFALMVETQAALRADIRQSLKTAELIAGVSLETEDRAALSEGAEATAFALIDAYEKTEATSVKAASQAADILNELLALPQPLRDHALEACGRSGWRNMTSGVKRLDLSLGGSVDVELYRIEPGRAVPRHTHGGDEFTLVVAGGFTDETGSYGPGDLSVMGPNDTHKPIGDDDGPCYALAISEGALRLTGMLGVLQRLLGR